MTEKKFNIGDKVMYKGCVCIIQGAHYTHFYNGAWWMYDLDNGSFIVSVAEKDIELVTTQPANEKPVRTKKNSQKRKK